ncbi:MAG: peroxiredoxin-like family protein [Thalassotalea sp.]
MKNFIIIPMLTTLLTLTSGFSAAKEIAADENAVRPLLNGQTVPNIMVTDTDGKQQPLNQVLNKQKTILFFYRGGWCPFCNTQLGQLKKIESKLADMGFQLIGISTDAADDLKASLNKHQASYQLLSDYHSNISQAFGLAYFTSKATTDRYVSMLKLKNPLQKNQQQEDRLVLPVPAVYIVDQQGMVQFNYVNPNIKVRLHEELLLQAASLVK